MIHHCWQTQTENSRDARSDAKDGQLVGRSKLACCMRHLAVATRVRRASAQQTLDVSFVNFTLASAANGCSMMNHVNALNALRAAV